VKSQASSPSSERATRPDVFPVVGIGASAGGLEACTTMLSHLPLDSGMAFVLVQHLDPKHESVLSDLLARSTRMPVMQVQDGVEVHPNHLYVIPPNRSIELVGGTLKLSPRVTEHGLSMPIDLFLRSLADQRKTQAFGVILSGTGSDGSLGIEAIKAEGGVTFAQDEESAKYNGMPHSAVQTGSVDFVLPPERIAVDIARIAKHRATHLEQLHTEPQENRGPQEKWGPERDSPLNTLFRLLKKTKGVDFASYKPSTIERRVFRRMALQRITSLEDYVQRLTETPHEIEALYQDLFIKVTRFFRDPEVFEALEQQVFPVFLQENNKEQPIRLWVPGCSTGEEVYSLAISLLEFLSKKDSVRQVQIFGTDINETNLKKARPGLYMENISLDVSPERLRRFFLKADPGYQISKGIRDICVFAKQDISKDPPFSRLDLISCRNLLIYLGPSLQNRVFPLFHYALKPNGHLLLGNAEAVGTFTHLFTPVDKTHRIFVKKAGANRDLSSFIFPRHRETKEENEPAAAKHGRGFNVQDEAERVILANYAPAGVIINDDFDILQFRGQTGDFLRPAPGKASLNVLKMAREGLLLELRALVTKAQKVHAPVRKEGVPVKYNGGFRDITLEVFPIAGPSSQGRFYLVLFKEQPPKSSAAGARKPASAQSRAGERELVQLKQDLSATKEYLQSIIEEQEATNEELKSANEEILSSNEELQSTNEELETAKEELQSTNEELTTVNEELQTRNAELNRINSDLNNLYSSVNLPVVMLGRDLRIRQFTPLAEKVLKLIRSDLGRPIGDINLRIGVPQLESLLTEVIENGTVKEQDVQDQTGRWYSLRVRPYKTDDNRIDGAVIVLVDVDELTRISEGLQMSRDFAEAILETTREPVLVLDQRHRVQRVNRAFCEMFHVASQDVKDRFLYGLGNGQWNIPELQVHLEGVLSTDEVFQDFEVEHDFPAIGRRSLLLYGRRIVQDGNQPMVLLAIHDVTARKQKDLQQAQSSLKEKEVLLKEIHHRVKNNLQVISSLLRVQSQHAEDRSPIEILRESQNRIRSMALIHEKLYGSDDLAKIDFKQYVESLSSHLLVAYGADPDSIRFQITANQIFLDVDAAIPLGLILNELLTNVLKHAFPGDRRGRINIELDQQDHQVRLTVQDDGVGLPKDFDLKHAVSMGLELVNTLTDQLEGTIEAHVDGGTAVTVSFPASAT